jgi:citrate lyase subunit beta / citryl-CoA lyase
VALRFWLSIIEARYISIRSKVNLPFKSVPTTIMPTAKTKLARSFLFVPGDRPERFSKALGSGADAVILDLEDAVGPAAKPIARQAILEYIVAEPSSALWIRINAIGTLAHSEDFAFIKELSTTLHRTGSSLSIQIMLPKVESRTLTEQMVASLAHPAGINIIAQIESALGLDQARDVAQSPCISRLAFGSIDYSLDLGLAADDDNALLHARSHLVWVSRLAGLAAPIDTVTVNLKDPAVIQHDAGLAKRLGFSGKLCIHPSQVAPVNEAFSPSLKEIAWARQVIEASAAAGDGAVSMGGQMIDRPVLLRAQRILDLAE